MGNVSLMDIDLWILRLFNQPFISSLNVLFVLLIYSVYGFILVLLYRFFRQEKRSRLVHLAIVFIIGFIFVNSLKYLVARPRPYETFPTDVKHVIFKPDPSFPSGHTFMAFICLWFLPKKFSKLAKALSIVYLLSVAVTSLYIGVHYPSDVAAGAILGLAFPRIISERMSVEIFKRLHRITKYIRIF